MNCYWFRPKRYGYGATPSTWEGWAATAVCVLLILAATLWLAPHGPAAMLPPVAVIVGLFVWICWTRTEGRWRWRWGEDD